MVRLVLIPDTLIGGAIYRRNQNEETRPTVVSKIDEVAGNGLAAVALMDHAVKTRPYCHVNNGHGGRGKGSQPAEMANSE